MKSENEPKMSVKNIYCEQPYCIIEILPNSGKIHFQVTLHLLLWDTHSLLSLALVSENNSYDGLNKMS
jgi:hypothetical protein